MSDLSINSAAYGPLNPVRSVGAISHPSSTGVRRLEGLEPSSPSFGEDRVELSEMARLLNQMRQMPEVRHDRIEDVRQAIARGEYDSPAALNAAFDRMINDAIDDESLGL